MYLCDPEKKTLFGCDMCDRSTIYLTKNKSSLNTHLITQTLYK